MASTRLDRLARDALDIDRLHDAQRTAAAASVAGRDVLAVLPTGFGKSAIYQLAGMERPGPTLVVSPLLALQRDQLAHLGDARAGTAAAISSATGVRARAETFEALRTGEIEFLFVAPEQLAREDVLTALQVARPSLAVVDEAHCVSAWGFDFRPDYLRLPAMLAALGRPPVLALTATAAPLVREDIVRGLRLREPVVLCGPFDRPNIALAARTFTDAGERDAATVSHVAAACAKGERGIVYTSTRARTVALATALAGEGVDAAAFHAGLARRTRDDVHERFASGRLDVVVATSAFGMGIDVPDVRFVVHADAPASLDAYAQEIGRAGRDGEPALALLHHRDADHALHAHLTSRGKVRAADVLAVAQLARAGGTVRLDVLRDQVEASPRATTRALLALELLGAVTVDPHEVRTVDRSMLDEDRLRHELEAMEERRRTVQRTRREMVRAYVETRGCRRRALRTYFADDAPATCGNCDNCCDGHARVQDPAAAQDARLAPDDTVRHASFGDGRVVRVEGDEVVVLFRDAGYRTLAIDHVLEAGLLRIE